MQTKADALDAVNTHVLSKLQVGLLVVWGCVTFGAMYFAHSLQRWVGKVGGWPLSFWLAAQGLVVFFVLIVVAYAFLANRAERH